MQAQRLHQHAPIAQAPLRLEEVVPPVPGPADLLLRVTACGVCHTDLHVVEGDLPPGPLPITPGHEVVGVVEQAGAQVSRFRPGDRVGVTWLHDACGTCAFCQAGQENLCPHAHFTGYTAQGGYAEYLRVPAAFAVPIPGAFSDGEAAPMLCAGVVGYRALRLADLQPGERLGLYGFGASAHLCIQVARHWGCEVCVFTRGADHRRQALELGAAWAGGAEDRPPAALDRAVIFAPAGWIVPAALGHLRPGGSLAINAIHMSDIPAFPYALLWGERTVRSVANVTRADAEEFLPLAAAIPIRPAVETLPLAEANQALARLKAAGVDGALVLLP